jgi:hypothetical protein
VAQRAWDAAREAGARVGFIWHDIAAHYPPGATGPRLSGPDGELPVLDPRAMKIVGVNIEPPTVPDQRVRRVITMLQKAQADCDAQTVCALARYAGAKLGFDLRAGTPAAVIEAADGAVRSAMRAALGDLPDEDLLTAAADGGLGAPQMAQSRRCALASAGLNVLLACSPEPTAAAWGAWGRLPGFFTEAAEAAAQEGYVVDAARRVVSYEGLAVAAPPAQRDLLARSATRVARTLRGDEPDPRRTGRLTSTLFGLYNPVPGLDNTEFRAAAALHTYKKIRCPDCDCEEAGHLARCRVATHGRHGELHDKIVATVVGWANRHGLPAVRRWTPLDGYSHIPDAVLGSPEDEMVVEVKTSWSWDGLHDERRRGEAQYAGGRRPWLIAMTAAGDLLPESYATIRAIEGAVPRAPGAPGLRESLAAVCARIAAKRQSRWVAAVGRCPAPRGAVASCAAA